jgi:GABA(A) receptor-associated protein
MLHKLDPIIIGVKHAYRNLNRKIEERQLDSFKEKYIFEKRYKESQSIIEKYPNRIPIIVERFNINLPEIDRKKYLTPADLTIGNFIYVIRKRLKMEAEKSLFLFFNEKMLPVSENLGYAYNKCKDEDGFLYVKYCEETTFG